ncbi:Piwi domain-containing protein [Aphelenchoides bicaudatus]|nr:Piwi domain-containing protein [Aphelenchoides bicaudatus]
MTTKSPALFMILLWFFGPLSGCHLKTWRLLSVRTVQRECCSDIISAYFNITNGFGVQCKYVYDGKAVLYTTKEINLERASRYSCKNPVTLQSSQLIQRAAQFVRGDSVTITILANKESYRLDYSNLRACLVGDVREQVDRSVRMFLEMVTSQYLVNDDRYQMAPLFDKQTTDLKDRNGSIHGVHLRVGLKKGTRVTDHPDKGPKAFIFGDMKRTAFFSTEIMSELYKKMVRGNNTRDFERFFRGVRMQLTYDPRRTFLYGSLSQSGLSDNRYKVGGKTIPQYMQETKGIKIQNVNFPGVHPDQPNGRSVIYPLECIRPLEGQLIPLEKLSTFAIRALLFENSVSPDVRYTYCNQQFNAMADNGGAEFLSQFGITAVKGSNSVKIFASPMPKILVGDKKIIQPKPDGSWNNDIANAKFLLPTTKLKNWYVVFDPSMPHNRNDVPQDLKGLEDIFKQAKESKVQFIFYIDNKNTKSHGELKLFEAYYKVLTQQVVVQNLKNGPQTLKNVLLKLNVKAFGLNYLPLVSSPNLTDLTLNNSDLLIIGYDIAPAEKMDAKDFADYCCRNKLDPKVTKIRSLHPASVGICSNKSKEPHLFSGDFFYQEPNGGLVNGEKLSVAVKNIVESLPNDRKNIKRLIVFRDGVSEGEQSQVLKEELPAVRRGFATGLKRTGITFIIATKMHNKRFFRFDGKNVSNTRAGDCIRGDSVRSDITELFVQPHHPLKGMPKIPAFDVLENGIGLSNQQMEDMIIYLANMHQVSACPTSLPLPVFMADETAKRADEIYKAFIFKRKIQDKFMPNITQTNGMVDLDTLSCLYYHGHGLYGTRFNA